MIWVCFTPRDPQKPLDIWMRLMLFGSMLIGGRSDLSHVALADRNDRILTPTLTHDELWQSNRRDSIRAWSESMVCVPLDHEMVLDLWIRESDQMPSTFVHGVLAALSVLTFGLVQSQTCSARVSAILRQHGVPVPRRIQTPAGLERWLFRHFREV